MKTIINFLNAATGTRSHCADHFDIEISSRHLNWEGILLEKGHCDHFHPNHVMIEDFYFAMLVDSDLEWRVEKDGTQSAIYSPSETVWINPPLTPFSNTADSEIDFLNIVISKDLLYKHYKGDLPEDTLVFLHDYNIQDKFISHMMYMFLEEVNNQGRNGRRFKDQLLGLFATYFIDNYSNISEINSKDNIQISVISNSQLKKIDAYIEANIHDMLTIEDLAGVLKMSKFQFLREFKKVKGITPYQHLITFRINTAKKLLETTNDSFTDIAMSLGFSDSSHFARTFKKYTNQTPTQYRLLNQ